MSFFLKAFEFRINVIEVGLVGAKESFVVVFLGFGVIEDINGFSEELLDILKRFKTFFVVVYGFDVVVEGVLFGFSGL